MKRKLINKTLAILIWIGLWFLISAIVNQKIFLPGPADTFCSLKELLVQSTFYKSILFTMGNIACGFLLGMVIGIILAILSCLNDFVGAIIDVPMKIIKAVPVASFIILVLLWASSKRLSIIISMLMVIPVIYANLVSAIKATDRKMLEMARIFRINFTDKIFGIYIPSVINEFSAACGLACGFAWKSGIAAEVIGLVRNSIGNNLYQSKIYLETGKLFAWTITIVILSVIFEKLIQLIIKIIAHVLCGGKNARSEKC